MPTTLAAKLQLKPDHRLLLLNAPHETKALLGRELPLATSKTNSVVALRHLARGGGKARSQGDSKSTYQPAASSGSPTPREHRE